MKQAISLLILAAFCGCAQNPMGPSNNPSGASTVAVPTPGPTWNTVYSNTMGSLSQVDDYSTFTFGNPSPFPRFYTGSYYVAPGEGLYQANSDGTAKTYYRNFTSSPAEIRATYWIYGIEDNLAVGIEDQTSPPTKSGFYFSIPGTGNRLIQIYSTVSPSSSYYTTLVSEPNASPATYDVWWQLTLVLDLNTRLSSYYVNGTLMASSINSNNTGPITDPAASGWASVLNMGANSSSTLTVGTVTLEVK